MKSRFKFGDIPIEVSHRGQLFYDKCKDYLTNEEPKFHILATDEDLQYEQDCAEDGVEYTKSYLEYIALYRLFCEKSVDYGVFLCHGSVVEVDGKAYLFTAPSGTGKSTHTKLWREVFKDRAIMINDDKPLLRIEDDAVYAYGTPWDGKHGLSTNKRSPLVGICFLYQDKENHIEKITAEKAVGLLMNQIYRPRNVEGLIKTMDFVDQLMKKVPMYKMGCNISTKAVKMAYDTMCKEKQNED